jgi:hypothetical protein
VPLDVEALLGNSPWLKGDPVLAAKTAWKTASGERKRAASGDSASAAGIAELKIAIDAADLLVWPLVREGVIKNGASAPNV